MEQPPRIKRSALVRCTGRSRLAAAFLLATLAAPQAAWTQWADARARGNPCAAMQEEPQRRRQQPPPFFYNGVDKLQAPMPAPIALPAGEFDGDWRASCIVFDVVFRETNGQLEVAQQQFRGVYPGRSSSALAAHQQIAADVLHKVPFAQVLGRRPVPGVPQRIAIPLWPPHGFYAASGAQVIGRDLEGLGYSDAERLHDAGGVAVYKVFDQPGRGVLSFVVVRDIAEDEPIAPVEKVTSPIDGRPRERFGGKVGDIWQTVIEPTLRQRPERTLSVEVHHYARGLVVRHDPRNADLSLPLAVDPRTGKPVANPLLKARYHGLRRGVGQPYAWEEQSHGTAYATLADLRRLLVQANLPPEEKRRRATAAYAEAAAAQAARDRELDAQQKAVRAQSDPANPLAALGYPEAVPVLDTARTKYYLSTAGSAWRVVVAVHAIGEREPVLEMVPGEVGGLRYTERHLAFVREKLVPAAVARWPDLRRLWIHHHVAGQSLEDTPLFRRQVRGAGLTYEQPLFIEDHALTQGTPAWRPFYEVVQVGEREIVLRRNELNLTVADARTERTKKNAEARLAALTPEARRAELRAQRLKVQAERSRQHVWKSDYFWMQHPQFDIPQFVFNGEFGAFEIRQQFPMHFVHFVVAYSAHCKDEIKKRDHKYYYRRWREIEVDGLGNTKSVGPWQESERFVPRAFVDKYEAYEQQVGLDMLENFASALFSSRGDAGQRFGAWIFNEKIPQMVGGAFAWRSFLRAHPCTGPTIHQMRENMLRAANGAPSLQAAGIAVPNAAAETQPLVPPPGEETVFDGCYANHDYKDRAFCGCMDTRAQSVMQPAERRRYAEDFGRYYEEIVFPDKGGPADPRWRLYDLLKQCKP